MLICNFKAVRVSKSTGITQPSENEMFQTPLEKHMLFKYTAGAVQQSASGSEVKSSIKGRANSCNYLTQLQAFHGPVCAAASGSTENRALLTLRLSLCQL